MTPRIEIIRRATDFPWDRSRCAIFVLDGIEFESGSPHGEAQVAEINTALDRLVDFVNAVALST
jgi:hypothetical protein